MFKTEFFTFQHVRSETAVLEVLRAEHYSMPLVINEYCDSVFQTIQMPAPVRYKFINSMVYINFSVD
jgi:hypothetical protein